MDKIAWKVPSPSVDQKKRRLAFATKYLAKDLLY